MMEQRAENREKLLEGQINQLYDSLENDNIAAANRIIASMGDSRNALAVEPLCILLEYEDDSIRGSSAIALGKIGDKAAMRPLVNSLKNSSDQAKISIVTALGTIGDKSVIRSLENIPLTQEEPRLINAVRSAVFKINHPNGPDTLNPPPAAGPQQPVVDVPSPWDREILDLTPPEAEKKSPILAAIGSFLIPGLGQVYNGEGYLKGFLYYVGTFIGSLLIFPGLLVWGYGIYNAYSVAEKINAGEIESIDTSITKLVIYAITVAIVVPVLIMAIIVILVVGIDVLVFGTAGT